MSRVEELQDNLIKTGKSAELDAFPTVTAWVALRIHGRGNSLEAPVKTAILHGGGWELSGVKGRHRDCGEETTIFLANPHNFLK